ncbi:flagellar protein FlgN [Nocardioides sp.]|uniref:flagellar protein FlgN n=1 Tax=Nocardioides sp. TaxID=35761 RepID=UPI0019BEB69C|nr:flagellar protein FlgN [Nocardioides sp.]MBC7278224.1 flagellar protein FlgN [Nocardioides sp.]
MADVKINIETLDRIASQLDAIVTEFENATSNSEELEAAIAKPYGRSELREKAQDFEERWDGKREKLKESLDELHKHVKGVVDGFTNWDSETALQFESNTSVQAPGSPGNAPASSPAAV